MKTEPNDPIVPSIKKVAVIHDNPIAAALLPEYEMRGTPGLTKLEYFANHAPERVPDWFEPILQPQPSKMLDYDREEEQRYIIRITRRYFRWRIYYAHELIAQLNRASLTPPPP